MISSPIKIEKYLFVFTKVKKKFVAPLCLSSQKSNKDLCGNASEDP